MNYLAQASIPSRGGTGDILTIQAFEWVFANLISVVLELAGIVFFIMILIGGFKYLTAGSDPKSAEAAKKTLTYAIAGLILLAMALLIFALIHTITGIDLLHFNVYLSP
jgi:hypothetical protein